MADQSGGNGLSNQGGQVWRNNVHLFHQIPPEVFPVFGEFDNSLGKGANVDQVDLVDITTHTRPRGVQDISCPRLVVFENLLQGGQRVVGQCRPVTNGHCEETILMCVGNELVELGKVPAVPFSNTHRKGVEILVELVGQRDGLDDHVVTSVDVELAALVTLLVIPLWKLTLTFPLEYE